MTNGKKARIAFKEELAQIKDETLSELVVTVFDEISADDFFTVGASTSCRYHPTCTIGTHGLIKHTKMVVWWAQQLFRAFEQGAQIDKDAVIAACLLHDIIKNGPRECDVNYSRAFSGHVTSYHGSMLATILLKDYPHLGVEVIAGVANHMGTWSDNTQKSNFDRYFGKSVEFIEPTIVHLADYCASRKVDSLYESIERMDFKELA